MICEKVQKWRILGGMLGEEDMREKEGLLYSKKSSP